MAATVTIKQSGDKNYWVKHDPVRLGDQGKQAVLSIMSTMRDAISMQQYLQTNYIHQEDFKTPIPFQPYDGKIGNTWKYYYAAINRWLMIKDIDANQLNCYQSFIDTHLALAYYQRLLVGVAYLLLCSVQMMPTFPYHVQMKRKFFQEWRICCSMRWKI